MSEDSDAFAPEFIVPSENRLLQTVDEAKWRKHTQEEVARREAEEQARREAEEQARREAEEQADNTAAKKIEKLNKMLASLDDDS